MGHGACGSWIQALPQTSIASAMALEELSTTVNLKQEADSEQVLTHASYIAQQSQSQQTLAKSKLQGTNSSVSPPKSSQH